MRLKKTTKGKGRKDSAAGIWRNEAKFLNDYLVVQNEPPAVIANGKNSVISSPTIMDQEESGDRPSSRWIHAAQQFTPGRSAVSEHGRGHANRGRKQILERGMIRPWIKNFDEWIASNT